MSEGARPDGPSHVKAIAPETLERERALLSDLKRKPLLRRLAGYAGLSGPGWLQAAFTLGGGTLASSLFAGTVMGYRLLWVQPLAMICGVIMFTAVARQALNTDERPFAAVRRHVHPAMAYGWALASLLASLIWCLPQYSLSISVVSDMLGRPLEGARSLPPSIVILGLVLLIVWNYGSSKGVKLFETLIKLCVAMIIVCFGLVVLRIPLDGSAIASGFFGFHLPVPGTHYPGWEQAAAQFTAQAAAQGQPDPRFMDRIGASGSDILIAAGATAVGINMTFMYPYTLRARGWTREYTGLAQFDLWTGMLIPFVVATSLIVIAAAAVLHGDASFAQLNPASPVKASAGDLAKAIEPVTGKFFAHVVFGMGVLGMTVSSICMLHLVSGFIVCELMGDVPGGRWYKFGMLLPSAGILGPLVWAKYGFYLAIPTSVINFFFLPIAYISFFVLDNRKDYLGEARPKGLRRIAWNVAMAAVIAIVATGAVYKIGQMLPDLLKKLQG